MALDPAAIDSFSALALGFAFAGLASSAFEMIGGRSLGIARLHEGGPGAYAAVPVLVVSAPVLILRAILRAPPAARPTGGGIMLATIVACGWSLLSGRLVLDLALLLTGA